jgi:membrane protease subunit HflC
VFDVPTQELLVRTGDDARNTQRSVPLTFDLYVSWRLAGKTAERDPVDQFVRSFGESVRAQDYLRSQVVSRLKVEMSTLTFDQLVNTDSSKLQLQPMLARLRSSELREQAAEHGLEIVDVQLRRFNHPASVRSEVINRIREDQNRLAASYQNDGQLEYTKIVEEGNRRAKAIRTEAETVKKEKEAEAQRAASRLFVEAQREAPRVYELLLHLDSYKEWLGDNRTQLILSMDHPLLKWLNHPPGDRVVPKPDGAMKPTSPP